MPHLEQTDVNMTKHDVIKFNPCYTRIFQLSNQSNSILTDKRYYL
ncbi:hypothetical protein T01_12822 [Trichinella spiralis]|uniref:Uncharacterized protein n=1 Tax=Trichinella spiralis TaxID=6334 RepID=A0A0V0YRD2_TRISP|nr:hypothetical protein T01_12822 [Trichinella spiralis]